MLAQERIELRPARLFHGKVAELASFRGECFGVARTGGAVQIEEAANVNVPRLAGVEAMKHFDLGARKEMRHGVAGRQHRNGIELADLGCGAQEYFISSQLFAAGSIKEPCGSVAASADRCLQRTQD